MTFIKRLHRGSCAALKGRVQNPSIPCPPPHPSRPVYQSSPIPPGLELTATPHNHFYLYTTRRSDMFFRNRRRELAASWEVVEYKVVEPVPVCDEDDEGQPALIDYILSRSPHLTFVSLYCQILTFRSSLKRT